MIEIDDDDGGLHAAFVLGHASAFDPAFMGGTKRAPRRLICTTGFVSLRA